MNLIEAEELIMEKCQKLEEIKEDDLKTPELKLALSVLKKNGYKVFIKN